MKIKAGHAIFATLELALDTAANQRAINHLLLQHIADGDEAVYRDLLSELNVGVNRELVLLRARLLRHSEIEIDDLLNGNFDF